MTNFVLSPAAESDLASIWLYTAALWGVEQAHRYSLEINTACMALTAGRRTGRSIDDVRSGYKKLSVGSHFVVYRRHRQHDRRGPYPSPAHGHPFTPGTVTVAIRA
jgi:toxin ParE1/3/4